MNLMPLKVRWPGTARDTADQARSPAIIDAASGRVTTYADLDWQVDALLDHLGSTRRILLVEATPDLSTIILYLAAWTGQHVVILCPPDRHDDLARLAERFLPDFIAAGDTIGDAVARLTQYDNSASSSVDPNLALVLPTSGSTGAAKAVRLSHANLVANAQSIGEYLGIGADERALLNLPIHYSYGLSVLNSHLLAGASVILESRSLIDPGLWVDAERFGATSFAGVPYSYELLDQVGLSDRAPSTLRYFTQAGGRLPPERVARYGELARARGWRLFVMYGQTEATARMAYLPPEVLADEPDAIGRAIPGGAFSLIGDDGATVEGIGNVGELVYTGPNVMMGYATERADLALPAMSPVLTTGDMAERTPSGLYRITGRKSRFVKIFGNRIDLDEVERIVERNGIAAVATGTDDQLVVAIEAGNTKTADCVVPILVAALKLPADRIVVLLPPILPRLPSGKIDYPQLRKLAAERVVTPVGTGDAAVREAFARAFGDDGRDDQASFASLGGDSLTYVTLAITLEDILGALPEDWVSMPIGELTALAAAAGSPVLSDPASKAGSVHDNLDTLRGLACLLVVAFHVIGLDQTQGMRVPAGSWWHAVVDSIDFVRMPLFTAMAGYFYALMPMFGEPRGRFLLRKVRSLLVPSFFVGTVVWILRQMTGAAQPPLVPSVVFGFQHLWYLNALFVVFVGVAILERRQAMSRTLGILIVLVALPIDPIADATGAFFVRNVVYLVPYFLFGMAMRRAPGLVYTRHTIVGGAVAALAMLVIELYWRLSGLPIPWYEAVLLPLAGFAVVPPLFRFVPRIRTFAWVGAYSITIYLWHPLANGAVRSIVSKVTTQDSVLFMVGMIAGVALPVILHRLVEHWPRVSLPLIGR